MIYILLHLQKKNMITDATLKEIVKDIAENNLYMLDYTLELFFSNLKNADYNKYKNNLKKFVEKNWFEIKATNYEIDIEPLIHQYDKLKNTITQSSGKTIAYFSPEFGFHESLPNYAGGLGILAGDVIKTAIMNNINMVGVGLFYSKGYFKQVIENSSQKAKYYKVNKNVHNIVELTDKFAKQIVIEIPIGDLIIKVLAYKLILANKFVILLSTDTKENGEFSKITENLYTGNRYLRLLQEIILGIGGVRALKEAGIEIDYLHINEGHASFAIWERAELYAKEKNIDIFSAISELRNSTLFTTHTPVIHGNEEFEVEILEKNLNHLISNFEKNFPKFIQMGKTKSIDEKMFSMTAFGIELSGISNGVSKLHGQTATKMWEDVYLNNKNIQPMTYVTNGIHFDSWMAYEIKILLSKIKPESIEESIKSLKSNDLLSLRKKLRLNLDNELQNVKIQNFASLQIDKSEFENGLIIGFARRFAPYKQANLLLCDVERLKKILNGAGLPIKIIFSGKAHPKDKDGKKIISELITSIKENELEKNILFVEDYDIKIGRLLVQGCDVWLNNPQKPLEACGTSGMKSALNFGVNLSVDDGWWYEAYNGKNGFVLNGDLKNSEIAEQIYDILEYVIIPEFGNSLKGKNSKWIELMKNSFLTVINNFSSERMLEDYLKLLRYDY